MSRQIDKTERELFTKEETDDIYVASTNILEDINDVLNGYKIAAEHLNALKNEMVNTDKVITFDIFGSISSSKDQIRTLGNIKHRENEKNKFAILNINDNTTLDEYKKRIEQIIENIKSCLEKYKNTVEIQFTKLGDLEDGLNIFYINPENAINQVENTETDLYKIILKENVNCLPLANIMYYNNNNKTLPLGMHVTDGIIINTKDLKLKQKKSYRII